MSKNFKVRNITNMLVVIFVPTLLLFFISVLFSFYLDNKVDGFGLNNFELNKDIQYNEGTKNLENLISILGLKTNTKNILVDEEKIVSGGVGKNGIPSLISPKFIDIDSKNSLNISDETLGVVYEGESTIRFYPYNILVWHEIINDNVDGKNIAITFCPLCASSIGYNRDLNGEVLSFGVSGLLYESNLLMYDNKTETLWSQIEGRGVLGDFAGEVLEIVQVQTMEYKKFKKLKGNKNLEVLSDDTGFKRDYSVYPYGKYNENEDLYFSVTYKDKRLPLKEIMYAITTDSLIPVSFVFEKLRTEKEGQLTLSNGEVLKFLYKNDFVKVTNIQGEQIPGYFTQWFSWANHNLEGGVNKDAKGEVWGI